MKPQYQHRLTTSYMLWFENFLMQRGEAYSAQTGTFTYYQDDALPSGFSAFGLPFKQIVYDSSITGASVPSGIYVNGSFTPSQSGTFDFENGRFISSGIPTGAVVTGSFYSKDLSIYYTNDSEENIVLDIEEKINKSVSNPYAYYPPNLQKLPAIYISNDSMENKPFAFGGLNETVTSARAVVIANDGFQLDTVLSVFADSYNEVIAMADFETHPLNEFGGLKTGYYSYNDVKNTFPKELFVKTVNTSKLSSKLKQNLLKDLYVGFIDFELATYRYRNT